MEKNRERGSEDDDGEEVGREVVRRMTEEGERATEENNGEEGERERER